MTTTSFRPWISMIIAAGMAVGCGDNKGVDAPDDGADPPDTREPGDPTTGKWLPGFSLPGPSGFGSRVEDVAIAGDGRVVVGGIFGEVAGVAASNIALWTGSDWAPLGAGRNGWVRALSFDSSDTLWAASTGIDVSDGVLASWDGTAWTEAPALDGPIRDFAFVGNGVAAVGDFTGGVRVYRPATNTWEDVTPNGIAGSVSAVATNTNGFCVAGVFSAIDGVSADNAACWNGTAWTRLGNDLPGGVAVLAKSPAGTWYAGGTLTYEDWDTGEYQTGIAVLVGNTWQPFQGGIDNGYVNQVRTIAFVGNDVLVGGQFESAGPDEVPARNIARYSPTAGWSQLGGGIFNEIGVFAPSITGAGDIEVASDGSIWVGGLFTRANDLPAVNLARVAADGTVAAVVGPRPLLGIGGLVNAVADDGNGGLIAGGGFGFAGQVKMQNIGRLDGTAWTGLGDGVAGIVRDVLVREDGHIAIAGELDFGGTTVAVLEWNGNAWTEPAGRVEGAGFTLAEDALGNLWVGGDLVTANGNPASGAARVVDGAWVSAGTFDGRVVDLALHGESMIAGGTFSTIDGQPSIALAVYQGTGWTQLGPVDGEYASVNAIAVSPELGVVIAGEFTGVDGVAAVDLARWDGTAWHALGARFEPETYSFVSALRPYGKGLFIAGGFDDVGGTSARNLAWYDGRTWHALGDGLADLAESLVVIDDVLYVGGPFTEVNGAPSSGLATWDFRRAQ